MRNFIKFALNAFIFAFIVAFAVYAVPLHTAWPSGSLVVSPAYPLPVLTDALVTGYIGSQTMVATISSAIKIGTLTDLTREIEIFAVGDAVNIGGAGLQSSGEEFIATNSSKVFKVATTTPAIYLRGQTTSVTCRIYHKG